MKKQFLAYFFISLWTPFLVGYTVEDLITPWRFDIAAKHLYAEHYYKKIESQWPKKLYLQHIQALNNFQETWPEKHCAQDFLNAFHELIDSMSEVGLKKGTFIPIDRSGNICNGAHRTATCLLFGIHPPTRVYDVSAPCISAKVLQSRGLEQIYLDAIALRYCQLKKNSFVAIIFPAAEIDSKIIEKTIAKHATIVYQKKITLTDQGAFNLIADLYQDQPWTGSWHNEFAGIKAKTLGCFPDFNAHTIQVFLLESDSLDNIICAKKEVRQLCGKGNDSIHITDTHQEALLLAKTLFLDNSLHLLNYANHQQFPHFEEYFSAYKKALDTLTNNPEWYCIDASAVLSVYGLRDCTDFDYLHHAKDELKQVHPKLASHNSSIKHYTVSLDEIIFNPSFHCYYRGIKFASLDVVAAMKQKRNDAKDQIDINLIQNLLNN